LSCVYRKTDSVVVCFFGDAAANIGAFHESLNMAAVMKLPVVWVCENNQYGLSTCICRTLAGGSIGLRAAAYGHDRLHRGRHNVVEVLDAARSAIDRAREGRGPSLIEAVHLPLVRPRGFGQPLLSDEGRRSTQWAAKCPIKHYTAMLLEQGILSEDAAQGP